MLSLRDLQVEKWLQGTYPKGEAMSAFRSSLAAVGRHLQRPIVEAAFRQRTAAINDQDHPDADYDFDACDDETGPEAEEIGDRADNLLAIQRWRPGLGSTKINLHVPRKLFGEARQHVAQQWGISPRMVRECWADYCEWAPNRASDIAE